MNLLTSCEKEANVKLPETKPLPVLFSYISPQDTLIRVKLTMSQPLYGTASGDISDPVTNATIILSSTQGNITLLYNNQSGYYEAMSNTYPIYYGATYKLGVTLANGSFAEAETTVPGNIIPILNASAEALTVNNMPQTRFKLNFNDDGSTVNYYRVSVLGIEYNFPLDTFFSETGIRAIYTDLNNNGKNMEVSFENYGGNNLGQIGYDIYLLNCNKDYFQFYKSIFNYQNGNPFAEPSLIYSNVKGGFGVFSAYTMSKYRLNI